MAWATRLRAAAKRSRAPFAPSTCHSRIVLSSTRHGNSVLLAARLRPSARSFSPLPAKGLVRLEFEARVQKMNPEYDSAAGIQGSPRSLPSRTQRIFRGPASRVLLPARSPRNRVPTRVLACAARNSLRRNPQLPRHRSSHRPSACLPCRRHVEQPESRRHRRPLPPGDRIERLALRLRRRPRHQAQVARPGASESSSLSSARNRRIDAGQATALAFR